MNKDHLKGGLDDMKGRVKEELGHVTGDTRTETEGFGSRIKGKVEKGLGDARDAIKRGADKVLDKDRGNDDIGGGRRNDDIGKV